MAIALSPGLRQLWNELENPVMGKEFRSRMRGARSYTITGVYAIIVAVAVLLTYWTLTLNSTGAVAVAGPTGAFALGGANQLAAATGRGIWTWGCVVQAFLIPLMVPAFTCGAITLERVRQLLELLLLTRQSAFQICIGKAGAGIGLGLVLVLSSVPALALSLILGGVAPSEIVASLAVLVSSVLAAGMLGLALSTIAPKTMTATVIAYLLVGLGLIGLPFLAFFLDQANALHHSGSEWGILAILLTLIALAFPPALALGGLGVWLYRRRTRNNPARHWRMLVTGFAWSGLVGFLYLPGMVNILLEGQVLVLLHPALAIFGVMEPPRWSAFSPMLWFLCTLAYTSSAICLFIVSVARVRALRAF